MFHFDQVTAGWRILSPFAKTRSFKNFIYFWGRFNQLEVFTKRPNGPIVTSSLFISILYSALILYTSIFYIKIGDFSKAVPSYCITGLMTSAYAAAWNLALKDRMIYGMKDQPYSMRFISINSNRVIILQLEYPAGYGIAVVSYVQMAVLCITGQNISERNERIFKALYEFKWYFLPTKYQKDVM